MAIQIEAAGSFEGQRIDEAVLLSSEGVRVTIMSWGVTVRDWRVPVQGGVRPVVLGFDSFSPYPEHSPHLGSLAGRVANRIKDASFELDGHTYKLPANASPNHLHGGPEGIGRQVWEMEPDNTANAVRFSHLSEDGAMGYPGAVRFCAIYKLTGHRLELEITAEMDRRTPVSVVQHQYFNLGTGTDVLDHTVRITAGARTELDAALVPTGVILPVEGTVFDFRDGRTLRDGTGKPISYDGNFILDTDRDRALPVAWANGPDKALGLKLWTDQIGLQFYNSVTTNVQVPGLMGRRYGQYSGLCLEDQAFPDALNNRHFPSIIHGPDRPYSHNCAIEIAPMA